ncbi:MAG: FKBP-type peptidyl-prolyl cis-trans isomerase [Planctomycetota bacterium]|nr:FKBP-type peptidyl-prolyl cis-trans isomerase [Planctomycetota bacterium]
MVLGRILTLFRGRKRPEFVLPSDDQLVTTASGLRYQILDPGSGRSPVPTDTVTVRYAGWTLEGQLFDASYPGKSTFPLGRVIPGWTEGLQHLMTGGTAILVIPSDLAYGPHGAPPKIGPNATLVFRVDLVSVG